MYLEKLHTTFILNLVFAFFLFSLSLNPGEYDRWYFWYLKYNDSIASDSCCFWIWTATYRKILGFLSSGWILVWKSTWKPNRDNVWTTHFFGWSIHSLPSIRMRIIVRTLWDESREKVQNLTMQARVRWESILSGYNTDGIGWIAGLTPKQWHKNQQEPLWLKSLWFYDLCLHHLEE